ncbi:hypothetical protein HGRIS_001566 [Hohenbuehelia grisea]|uniref:S-adenosyl-L-methionine-dependent methyltransferase n=1 Tax=Hohenbuehelia grisea TaxID=104357 RepID=A0ABR3JQA1_9AGAR
MKTQVYDGNTSAAPLTMTSPVRRHIESSSYVFQHAFGVPEEIKRLDELHEGISEYFDQHLALVDLSDMQPQNILELGAGSGAWAIQAVLQFPKATVLAADKASLPERPFRPMWYSKSRSYRAAFAVYQSGYDIVHAWLVMMHLPSGPGILRHVCKLVKPGGWLIVEEPDDDNMANAGPANKEFVFIWLNLMRERGSSLHWQRP